MGKITCNEFGQTRDGKKVTAYLLENGNGMSATVLDYGCTVQSLIVPDRNANPTDVVLGYGDVASYEQGDCYYGAFVGRYANRIKDSRFVLGGREYRLTPNFNNHHLHGVFPQRVFDASVEGDDLVLTYLSPDMEEGYPGNLSVEVRYSLAKDNALEIRYSATTDKLTILNLTNHSYFNLNGQDGSTVMDHRLRMNCSYFTEYDETFAQTGRLIPVENTPLDFRKEEFLKTHYNDDFEQMKICGGYDHNMVIDGEDGVFKLMGTVRSDRTGIVMEAYTTEPGIQFYSGNFMAGDPVPFGKGGIRYPKCGGLCLEAQHFPDGINQPHYPNTVLKPGETYTQRTVYRFSTEKA